MGRLPCGGGACRPSGGQEPPSSAAAGAELGLPHGAALLLSALAVDTHLHRMCANEVAACTSLFSVLS
jgi:hypothetical protein